MPLLFQRILDRRGFSVGALAGLIAGVALHASAQPEVYGKPDSSAFIRIPPDTDDWTRHFRIGGMVGLNLSANFNVKRGAIAGNNPLLGLYDDGYVRTDQTGNKGGYTTFWGYNNASQYSAAAQSLTMHSASAFTTTSGGSGSADAGPLPGFDLAYGGNLWYWKHARVGWELGFGLLPFSITDTHVLAGSVNQSVYTFNTGGILLPGAPYLGTYNGPGALLGTNYTVSTSSSQTGTITGSRTLDGILYTVRLGPSFYWDLTKNLGMSLGAGPAIGIVSGDCSYNELLTIGSTKTPNKGSFGGTDVVFGGYVNGAVMYHFQDNYRNADIYLGVQYLPMQDANFNTTGRSGQLNLGGQLYLSAGINWPF